MLADDVLRKCDTAATRGILERELRQAHYIRIQNVADFFWLHEQNEWDTREDFPCVALPWSPAWFEWRQPRQAVIDGQWSPLPPGWPAASFGVLARMIENPVPAYAVKWDLTFVVCGEVGPLVEMHFPVDAVGRIVHIPVADGVLHPITVFPASGVTDVMPLAERRRVASSLDICCAYPVLLALSFCHAKNVSISPEPIPARLQAARARRHHLPIERFYTLDIEPMRAVIAAATREGQPASLSAALHLVRGHFKTYTAEAPLFGARTGIYWWGLHARGDSRRGAIRKDYNVLAP